MSDKIVPTITLLILRMEDSSVIVYRYSTKSQSPSVATLRLPVSVLPTS